MFRFDKVFVNLSFDFVILTEQEKKHAVKVYHETSSLRKVRRLFRKSLGYHAKNLPSLSTIRHVVENFSVHGGV